MSGVLAPDGGWGWMCVLGCGFMHFLFGGFERSYGVVYVKVLEKFQCSATTASTIGAVFTALRFGCGPIVSAITKKFSVKTVTLAGTVVFVSGCMLCSFATSPLYMFFTYSIMCGIGSALVYFPAVVIVGQYFHKRRGVAMGFATAGAGIGTFFIPPLYRILFEEYGFSGTFQIMSSVLLNLLVCSLLYRPLSCNGNGPQRLSQASGSRPEGVTRLRNDPLDDVHKDDVSASLLARHHIAASDKNQDGEASSSLTRRLSSECAPNGDVFDDRADSKYTACENRVEADSQKNSNRSAEDDMRLLNEPASVSEYESIEKPRPRDGLNEVVRTADKMEINKTEINGVILVTDTSEQKTCKEINMPAEENFTRQNKAVTVTVSVDDEIVSNLSESVERLKSVVSRRLSADAVRTKTRTGTVCCRQQRCSGAEDDEVCENVVDEKDLLLPSRPRPKYGTDRHTRSESAIRTRTASSRPHSCSCDEDDAAENDSLVQKHKYNKDIADDDDDGCYRGGLFSDCCLICLRQINDTFGLRLLVSSPALSCYVLAQCLATMAYVSGQQLIVAHTMIVDISSKDLAVYILSIIGLTDTLGRVGSGFLYDIPIVRRVRPYVYVLVIFSLGSTLLIIAFCKSFAQIAVMVAVNGLFTGALVAGRPVIVVDVGGLENMSTAFAFTVFGQGVGVLLGPMFAGYLKDSTGTYFMSYVFIGCSCCAGAISLLLGYFFCGRATSSSQ